MRRLNGLADRVLNRLLDTGDASAASNCGWVRRCHDLLDLGPSDTWCKRWCCLDEHGVRHCEECIC